MNQQLPNCFLNFSFQFCISGMLLLSKFLAANFSSLLLFGCCLQPQFPSEASGKLDPLFGMGNVWEGETKRARASAVAARLCLRSSNSSFVAGRWRPKLTVAYLHKVPWELFLSGDIFFAVPFRTQNTALYSKATTRFFRC